MLELKNITDGDIHNLSLGIKPGECITLLDSGDQIMDRLTGTLQGNTWTMREIFSVTQKNGKKSKKQPGPGNDRFR